MNELVDPLQVDENYVTNRLELLPSVFSNSTNLRKFIAYLLTPHQEMERLIVELAQRHRLLTAEGVYLDNVGNKLGVPRTSMDDDSYRASILATTLGVRRNITRDNIVSILQEVTGDNDVTLNVLPPNSVNVNIFQACFTDANSIKTIQGLFPLTSNVTISTRDGTSFRFDGTDGDGSGFSDIGDTTDTGGQLENVIVNGE